MLIDKCQWNKQKHFKGLQTIPGRVLLGRLGIAQEPLAETGVLMWDCIDIGVGQGDILTNVV